MDRAKFMCDFLSSPYDGAIKSIGINSLWTVWCDADDDGLNTIYVEMQSTGKSYFH